MIDILQKAELIDMDKIDIKQSPMVKACDHDPTVREYWNLLVDKVQFPAIDLFWIDDLNSYVIADGRKRFLAHQLNNEEQILAVVHRGGMRKAVEHALGANKHGMRPTDADIRVSLGIILDDKEWSKLSNVAIGKMVGCSESTVRRFRAAMAPDISEESTASSADDPDTLPTETARKPRSAAKPKAKQEQTKRVGTDGKEYSLPKKPTPKPAVEGKEVIPVEKRKEVKDLWGKFYRTVKTVPEWEDAIKDECIAIAEKMKTHWGHRGNRNE